MFHLRALLTLWLLVAAVLAGGACQAQTKPPRGEDAEKLPPPRKEYMGRQIAPVMSYRHAAWLTREERDREEDSRTLMKVLGLKPGQVVCDMGCGNGYHTLKLAELVGERGRVLAVDIQPEMLTLLRERAKKAGVSNVQPVLGTVADPQLPKEGVDLILLVDVYHEFSYPERMLRAMRQSLKPDGRIVLVEFRAEDPEVPIRPLHKMTKKQVLREISTNGYRLVEEYDELPWQHVLFFGRAEADEEE